MDILGPFPMSSSGNRYIVVAVDHFTKFSIVKAIPNATSESTVDFFIERILLKHGAPTKLLTDRGRNFTSHFSRDLFCRLQTNHVTTTAYHPQCNGLVERLKRTLTQMLAMYLSTSQRDWDQLLAFVVFGYNTSRQDSTGHSPYFLLFGHEPKLPIYVTLNNQFDSF